MPTFVEISNKFNKNALKETFKSVFDNSIQKTIIKQIQYRLYKFGIVGDSQKLITDKHARGEYYAPLTIALKTKASEPTDRVTLNFTGAFYDSFVNIEDKDGFYIDAQFNKKNGHIYRNFTAKYNSEKRFENVITKLTPNEEKSMLRSLQPKIINELKIKTTK